MPENSNDSWGDMYVAAQKSLGDDLAILIETTARIGALAITCLNWIARSERGLEQLGLAGSEDIVTDIANLVRARTAPAEAEARRLAKRVEQLEAENAQLRLRLERSERGANRSLDEALNSGDGTYRP